ncbi:hypothetical protein D0Z07_6981 [Hyphodiscus hymeniophilus]|uniref:Oxidoreductase-like protein n=1 Tax=Hyphodiscus hymeniophilus TaxID=353542 RepID=A0A9P7AVJ5_9HELO|nr:hypothetical protein D0Z07_6981 [Hyphodiscus hymeniophilus]
MSSYVEAKSLSEITDIASNPPKYPRNPTWKQRNSLTLYIARVPGSKDIILTTLKPQLKNVTAEDVASSLYYFHLNTEDDARLLAEEQEYAQSEAPTESDVVGEKPLARKPLPDAARPSVDLSRSRDTDVRGPSQTTATEFHRKPLPVPAKPSLDPALGQGISKRRLYPMSHELSLISKPENCLEHQLNLKINPKKQCKESPWGHGPLSQNIQLRGYHSKSKVSSDSGPSDSSPYNEIKADGVAKSFTITVIRRDPSANAQWNVGSVTGESHGRAGKSNSNIKKPYFDIYVHLTTPGYTTFRSSPAVTSSGHQSQLHNRLAAQAESARPDWGFDRWVCMEGSNFFTRASKQHQRAQSESSDKLAGAYGNSISTLGVRSRNDTADARDSNPKGYEFISPWGGRCKFTTGGGGRSLRCKHTLPTSLSSSNAVFESSGSADVSELRFNHPHSAVLKAHIGTRSTEARLTEPKRFSIPKFGHIRNKISQATRPPLPPRPDASSYAAEYPNDDEEPPPLPPRAYTDQHVAGSSDEQELPPYSISQTNYTPRPPSEDYDDDERLDLSIGREMAGGGNRGNRAKLGKLIINDEGFKMLDLVVAANIGIWWSIFDTP